MENMKWWEMLEGGTNKPRVLVLTTLVNGIVVNQDDLMDEDMMRENNDF